MHPTPEQEARLSNRRRHPIHREIAALRRTLAALNRSLRRLGPKLAAAAQSGGPTPSAPKRGRLHLSRQRRAALKLHGRYLGYIRQLKPLQKAQVRKIRVAKGVRAAIARAMRMTGA